jgi:hypothetical protein
MPCNIKNPANIDLTSLEPHIQGMYDHFDQKFIFKKPPVMVFDSDSQNKANVLGKTAYYDPDSLEIHIYTDDRHPKDMLRSIAHELIHHRQNLEGRLNVGGYHGEGYYLENKELQKLEHEAMLEGNAVMREYEDTIKKENNQMSLKEWKNNELNKLLLKKFGILKEEKGKYDDGDGKDEKCDHVDCEDKKIDEELDEVLAGGGADVMKRDDEENLKEYFPDAESGVHDKRDDDLEEIRVTTAGTNSGSGKRDDKELEEYSFDGGAKAGDGSPTGKRDDNKLKHRNENKVNLKQLIEKVLKNNNRIMKKLKDK